MYFADLKRTHRLWANAAFVLGLVGFCATSQVAAQSHHRRRPLAPIPSAAAELEAEAQAQSPEAAPVPTVVPPDQDARTLHQDGQAAYLAGRYEEAIDQWLLAFRLVPRAGIQYNLSQAYGRLGRLPEERAALVRYLEMLATESPERLTEPQSESARQRIIAIDDRLASTGIVVRGAPRRARVLLDGVEVQLEQGGVSTGAGSHSLRVEVDGYEPFQSTVTVGAGLRAEVDVELELVSDHTSAEAAAVARRHHRRVAIGLAAAGAGVLGAGTALGLVAMGGARGQYVGSSEADSAKTYAIGADVAFGVGGGLLTTAFILWRVHHGEDPERAARLAPQVGVGSAGIAGRF